MAAMMHTLQGCVEDGEEVVDLVAFRTHTNAATIVARLSGGCGVWLVSGTHTFDPEMRPLIEAEGACIKTEAIRVDEAILSAASAMVSLESVYTCSCGHKLVQRPATREGFIPAPCNWCPACGSVDVDPNLWDVSRDTL